MKRIIIAVLLVSMSTFVIAQEADTLKAEDILKMSLTDLMNVKVISASKTEQQIKDVAASVQVISADQIKERGYFTLEEALSDLPGFQFRNIMGFNSYVFMRGAPSQNNLILLLVDGVQINELNSGGFYGGGQFNLADVERIEVVYGPASALYGTNAVSGIINIITKTAKEKNKGHLSLLGGNFNTGMGDFGFGNHNAEKQITYSVSGMYKTTEKGDLRGAKGDDNWSNEMENFEKDWALSAKVKIKNFNVGLVYQEKQSSMTTFYKSTGEKYLDKNTLWDIAFFNSFLKYNYERSKKWSVSTMLYYRNATVKPNTVDDILKATDTTAGSQVGYYRPNQMVGIESNIHYQATRRLMIIGGIVGEIEELSNGFSISTSAGQDIAPPTPSSPKLLENQLISYFAQADFKILESLSFIGGIRQDFSSYYGQPITPRLGLLFNKKKVTAKLLYNTAFRAPKPWDYTWGTGNSSLNPEKMQSLELFCSYLITEKLSVGTSVYQNRIDDKLTKETNATGSRWVNKHKLNTSGIEVFGNFTLNKIQIFANYTFNDSYDQDGYSIPEISMHTANAGFTYALNSHFKVNLRSNYIGTRDNPSIIPNTGDKIIGQVVLLNGCISYFNLKGFDLQFKINNILDQEYYHPSNLFAGRYRQPQRTITIKAGFSF